MEKALEILKQVKALSGWIKCGAELPFDSELDEAIAETEEALKPKTCDGCKWLAIGKYCTMPVGTCIRKSNDYFEPKEQ